MAIDEITAAPTARITLETLRQMRSARKPIAMLTAYDYPTAQILAAAGIPALLVGDSAAMTVLGETTTTAITFDFLLTITQAVRRGAPHVFLLADMPAGSYPDLPAALAHARRFVQEAGADAVKLECDRSQEPIVAGLAAAGLTVCAHVGLLPQRVTTPGGYRAHGRTQAEAREIVDDALVLHRAGAKMILLEAVPDEVSAQVSRQVDCPVIGCGGGPSCDGHVVVVHDMLGYSRHVPKFVDKLADVPALVSQAAARYLQQIQQREYPAPRHQYRMKGE